MIVRIALLIFLVLSCTAATCQTPNPSGSTTYATARSCIQGAELAVTAADSIFQIWCMFADSATCADAQSKFAHMKLDVLDGLQAALAAIDVAESQGSGFDLLQLMAKAEEAWGKIYKFLNDLGLPLASSLPEAKDSQNLPPMMKLPNTLLPSRR